MAAQSGTAVLLPINDAYACLRFLSGPGYRVYFARRGEAVVILLCGGDTSTQAADIMSAWAMAKEI
jgi:putative addiction module killer protein